MASKSKIGDVNRNNQRLIEKTEYPGNDHNQRIWVLECQVSQEGEACGHVYGANGSDFFQRKCPQCQGGQPGLMTPTPL
ncbi:hypothetical protein RWA02_17185 [Sinorhizobium meliloti]|uniref:hypothetical protein n=1 Tax=Rhizobium meliloti TaxID=382 RepID=UPI001296617D|nr:hypothetical protein [Sinorhizobium meliloti]MDW9386873.1 hypothetical protein [Sinorhizobium meliloti]MDW9625724.1 hypothetical protein [Sinorhizobium meliloti]MDW9996492.1 hypothetical protein [Sinorhizobium meliloti]